MNKSSTIRTSDGLNQSTKDIYSTAFSGDAMMENVTLSTEDEILKRLAVFLTYTIMVHSERIYFTFPAINFIIGLPGSVASFLLILRIKPFTSSSLYFCALAMADGLFVVFVMLATYSGLISKVLSKALCPVGEGIWEILTLFSNFILIVLAGERCLAVWFPLKVAVFTSVPKAKVGCIVCGLLVLPLRVHNFIIWRIDEYGNCFQVGIQGYDEFYLKVWSKVMPFLFSLAPSIVILMLNIIVVSGLRKSNEVRRLMTSGDDKTKKDTLTQSRQVTVMLISVSLVFLVTNVPYAIFQIFGETGGWLVSETDYEQFYTFKHAQSAVMMTFFIMWRDLNHSLNFLCYFLSTRRFREELWNVIVPHIRFYKARTKSRVPLISSLTETTRCVSSPSTFNTNP